MISSSSAFSTVSSTVSSTVFPPVSSSLHVALLLRIVLSASLAAASAGSLAQTRNPVAGAALFNNTPGDGGLNCISCHGSVQNRRQTISGSLTSAAAGYAAISVDTAQSRLSLAIQNNAGGVMNQFNTLSINNEISDLAAYIADTPKVSATTLTFTASAANSSPADQHVDLSIPKTEGIVVTGVALSGSGAARFSRSSDACNTQTLAAGAADCRISVRFTPNDTQVRSATLTITMQQGGSSTPFTRTVALNGSVGTTPSPTPTTPATSDSGGGALGFGWLAALGLVAALARRRG